MSELFCKKSLENAILKLENASDKKINKELIADCYLLLMRYKTPLSRQYDESVSGFCAELCSHISNKHHFPSDNVKRKWKNKLIVYLTYAKDHLDEFKTLLK
ncbi:MAG: hypothetical protein PHT91_02240 [Candidatus Nanoarchaeia archaeon]|nr:hypothetical protein [Candidatus Nanoarchaeia archaeon]MDD5054378.1 hypothetical protein [Candidatus Nanoarchaeia archaeon]MDD5499673.1 hypothetical protein [Candidatus Nanoarchaeia archaeon]